ncbi:hypothetical protein ACO22_02313 [Paracoccidioides brasiliensis]|uniref:Uncharacterized protein n=1 Tax=Paracoccidioides brasiliensis TaxID=121759 RepID=A0A1D2JJ01_PARBR|nr:hypothetical protein ACO22_02313 [Paracoccidioides brasiliensis]
MSGTLGGSRHENLAQHVETGAALGKRFLFDDCQVNREFEFRKINGPEDAFGAETPESRPLISYGNSTSR